MKILVSGFEPFGKEAINPTAKIIEHLQKRSDLAGSVRAVLLPVTFEEAFAKLSGEIREFDPEVVLSFGLAGGRSDSIEFERVAINCIDAEIPDNAGKQPRDERIDEFGESAYFSTLPIRTLIDALKAKGIAAKISNSAGTYVCNFLFYKLQDLNLRTRRRSGFIHVPFLPEQIADKPTGTPSMTLEMLITAVEQIIEALKSGDSRAQ